MVSDYTPPPITQATLKGAPYVTVSPVGLAQGYPKNNNANYGPDTPGTSTSGIQEAFDAATYVVLINPGGGQRFNIGTTTVYLPNHSLTVESRGLEDRTSTESATIYYTGTGYAIDSANPTNENNRYYLDGLIVNAAGSGVRFAFGCVPNIGRLELYGSGLAGSVGLTLGTASSGQMGTIDFLKIGVFENAISSAQDHVTIHHLETGFTTQASPVITVSQGYGLTVQYWHHYLTGTVAPSYLWYATGDTYGVLIENLLLEQYTYNFPTSAMFGASGQSWVPTVRVLNLTMPPGVVPTDAQITDFPGLVEYYPTLSSVTPASVSNVQNGLPHEFRAVSWNTGTASKVLQTAIIQLQAGTSGNPPNAPELYHNISGTGGLCYGWYVNNILQLGIDYLGEIRIGKFILTYQGIYTVENGVAPFRGASLRTGLTATDASPITVYSVPSSTGFFRISLTILGRNGTITSGIATLKYTVNGSVVTETVSILAVGNEAHISPMVQPDASTNITVQLTTLTGTAPSVDVACVVEGVSSGT